MEAFLFYNNKNYLNSISWFAALRAGNHEARKEITTTVEATSKKSEACSFIGK